jgi:L-alanine-DL-glutamate epimerase-like enolase superfamily enzyme
MRISRAETALVKSPSLYPYQLITQVEGADGARGVGYVRVANTGIARGAKAMADELLEQVAGKDWAGPGEMWAAMARLSTSIGPDGISNAAMATIDTACWDAFAKGLNLPLYQVLGGYRSKVRAYASFGINRETPSDDVGRVAQSIKDEGFTALKTRVAGSHRSPREDADRIRAIREAVGPDFDILIDCNFWWSATESARFGKLLEPLDLFWIEDVAPKHDVAGFRRVREALRIPVTTCERLEYAEQFREMLEAKAVDYVMIDIGKVGGITPWVQIAHLCNAFNVPVSGHAFSEINATLMCAVPNGVILEYFRPQDIFHDYTRVENGFVVPSDKPGLGIELNQEIFNRTKLD